MIDCALSGFLASDAENRTSQAGKSWVRFRIGVGKDDAIQWVSVAAFGKAAEVAAKLKKGDQAYVEGLLKLDTWTGKDGVERHGISVTARRVEQTHLIGKNRSKADGEKAPDRVSVATGQTYYSPRSAPANRSPGTGEFDDQIPFAPEVRG
ncbi:MAG: single-stranded DNA-binding protein [Xanthobacteraceae bacterium]